MLCILWHVFNRNMIHSVVLQTIRPTIGSVKHKLYFNGIKPTYVYWVQFSAIESFRINIIPSFCSLSCMSILSPYYRHTARSRASSFDFQDPLFSLRSFSSWLRLLRHLPVIPILPCSFPSTTCFRRQFQRKMWPIQLALGFEKSAASVFRTDESSLHEILLTI